MLFNERTGFTLIELLVVIGFVVVLGVLLLPNLTNRKGTTELDLTVKQMAALLREAQNNALTRASSSAWGVRFDNTSSTSAFYALFSGASYSTSTVVNRANLPRRIRYASSSIADGAVKDVVFALGTGRPSASSSIMLELTAGVGGASLASSTISVSTVGTVAF